MRHCGCGYPMHRSIQRRCSSAPFPPKRSHTSTPAHLLELQTSSPFPPRIRPPWEVARADAHLAHFSAGLENKSSRKPLTGVEGSPLTAPKGARVFPRLPGVKHSMGEVNLNTTEPGGGVTPVQCDCRPSPNRLGLRTMATQPLTGVTESLLTQSTAGVLTCTPHPGALGPRPLCLSRPGRWHIQHTFSLQPSPLPSCPGQKHTLNETVRCPRNPAHDLGNCNRHPSPDSTDQPPAQATLGAPSWERMLTTGSPFLLGGR